jgi:adenosine deaminase
VAEARLSEAQKRAEAAEMRADALQERLSIVSKAVVSAAATDGANDTHPYMSFIQLMFAPRSKILSLTCHVSDTGMSSIDDH